LLSRELFSSFPLSPLEEEEKKKSRRRKRKRERERERKKKLAFSSSLGSPPFFPPLALSKAAPWTSIVSSPISSLSRFQSAISR